jgi:hypothetical protein
MRSLGKHIFHSANFFACASVLKQHIPYRLFDSVAVDIA